MTAELSYYAKVSDTGAWEGLPRRKMQQEVRRLFGGQSIEIIIHRKKKHRSVQQNRYYWMAVTMLSDHTGFTKDEMHSVLKTKFLKTEKVNENTGVIYEYVKSTTELTTTEFMDYVADIQRFASEEFDIFIPDPGEQIEVFS